MSSTKPTDGPQDAPRRKGLSRRTLLQTASVGAGVAGSGVLAPEAAQAAVKTYGPGTVSLKLNVNGQTKKVEVEPRVTLLDALRNHLDITGAKKVCDRATCGACTMIVDGDPVYSCTMLAIEAQGSKIETIEGLTGPGGVHPIQKQFVAHDAQQCGFCTPGFVMASKALLDKNSNPTQAEVEDGLSGNICRCGTYMGLRQAVLDAAKEV